MVEIYTRGDAFTSILEDARIINGFNRDSYALRLTKDDKSILILAPVNGIIYPFGDKELIADVLNHLWYLNVKLGGVCAKSDIADEFSNLFINIYKGSSRAFTKNGDVTTYIFEEKELKRALFAGGCFWCISMPFYSLDGVVSVKSGYAGGDELFPSYLAVKHQETHHKECILIEYNPLVVDYERVLETYFENIDPFDNGGQYIDRGDSYAPAIFTSDKEERMRVIEYKYQLSDECERECTIPLCENKVFFLAEEEHQDFAIKHPKEMEEELVLSGRVKK